MNISSINARTSYITTDENFYIGTSTSITYMYFTYSLTQAIIDFYTNIVKIDNLKSSSNGNISITNGINMNGNTIINCPSFGGSTISSNSISVNTGGYNFLSQNYITKSGIVVFNCTSTSFMIENYNGEAAGICIDGSNTDNITIFTAGDGGSLCNFQDEDISNSRICYLNTSGILVVVSTKTRKHSIKEKNNNNILERIMKIKVKSYGYKYEFSENDNDKKRQRMINKSKKQIMGVILEEVYDVLPNIIDKYDNELDDKLIDDDNIKDKDITFKNKPKLEDI